MDYFNPQLDIGEINNLSMLGLAHVGDAVYQLMTRTLLCAEGHAQANDLHHRTVEYVNASSQAKAADRIQNLLTDEEMRVYKRGRNTRVHSVPHHAQISEYHAATGLEALFGYLFLQGRKDRLNELFLEIHREEL